MLPDYSYDAESHIYTGPHGRLPGATDIIKAAGLIKMEWMSPEARWRGKCVHKAIELFNKGTLNQNTVAEEYRGYLESFKEFLRVSKFKIEGFETPQFNTTYGTLPDIWGELNGVKTVIELKTGVVPDWAALQTALQVSALYPADVYDINRFGLQLRENGKISNLIPFDDIGDYPTAFGFVEGFHWKVKHGYISDWGGN